MWRSMMISAEFSDAIFYANIDIDANLTGESALTCFASCQLLAYRLRKQELNSPIFDSQYIQGTVCVAVLEM